MAQSERFYFWRGYYDAMEYLNDEEVGRLFRAICAYAFDGEMPDFSDERLLQVAWAMVADSVAESVDMGKRSSKGGQNSGETRRNKATTKGVRKGVQKPLPKGVSKGASNVEYGSTLSPTARESRRASPAAPDEHAAAVDRWYAEQGIEAPPVPEPKAAT